VTELSWLGVIRHGESIANAAADRAESAGLEVIEIAERDADVPLSRWFLIVASFGSLFVVSGKRHGEHIDLGEEGAEVRPTLGAYSRNYLQYVWTMTSGVTVAAYCLWAFEMAPKSETVPFYELSIVPFVTFILRYAMLLEQGHGESPEDLVLGDRMLMALAVIWIAVFGSGVYFLH